MFANSGIVSAVIPEWAQEMGCDGVFYNCKNLETVTFEAKKLDTYTFGYYYFQGCSKLKEITIPTIIADTLFRSNYTFADCTSLEKVTIYASVNSLDTGKWMFLNCTKLNKIEIFQVEEYTYDETGKITGYAKVKEAYFGNIYNDAFTNCASLKKIPLIPVDLKCFGACFAGCGIERFVLPGLKQFQTSGSLSTKYFAGMPNLKEIWINTAASSVIMTDDLFTDLENDVNIYFYNQTKEEVIKANRGKDGCFTNASEKAHFFFKDTMPTDVEWPEEIKPN
jgi:hypothetical protein